MLKKDQLGAIRVGHLADLAMLDLNTLPFTPLNDLRGQLVYCDPSTTVRLTMVNGRTVFENGQITTVDEAALLVEARELFARKQPAIAAAREAAGDVKPLYQTIVRKAAAADLGMNRWIGAAV
jgi:5-methylthioadenosine/S-adenosylhomocysteine deaminase